jgi:hypothetical protein
MRKTIAVVLAGALLLVAPAGIAMAGSGGGGGSGDVVEQGSCNGNSEWKLKLSSENSGIEAEFEVDQNVSGDRWRVKIKHDGDVAFSGTPTTGGASGSFSVRIVEGDNAGTDAFRARARNLSTGEVCVGAASF